MKKKGGTLMSLLGFLIRAAIALFIIGIITEEKIKVEMRKRQIETAIIRKIDTCKNQITLEDLETDNRFTISGDEISDELEEDQVIYA